MLNGQNERIAGMTEEAESRHPLPGIALLPSAATLGNLLCGFLAIYCCLLSIRAAYFDVAPMGVHRRLTAYFPTDVAIGAFLIVAAMIFDALDGRLARIARRTTEFGAQLDSIADVVSFGVAPAMLFITIMLRVAVPASGASDVSPTLWRLALLGALVYPSCAAIRLARYNAENIKDESGVKKFSGLPSPAAAAAFTALIALHEQFLTEGPVLWGVDWAEALRWAMGPAAIGLGLLMVSRLDFVHVFNVYARRLHPPTHLIWIVVAGVLWWYSPAVLLAVAAYAYLLTGLVRSVLRWRAGRGAAVEAPESRATVRK